MVNGADLLVGTKTQAVNIFWINIVYHLCIHNEPKYWSHRVFHKQAKLQGLMESLWLLCTKSPCSLQTSRCVQGDVARLSIFEAKLNNADACLSYDFWKNNFIGLGAGGGLGLLKLIERMNA